MTTSAEDVNRKDICSACNGEGWYLSATPEGHPTQASCDDCLGTGKLSYPFANAHAAQPAQDDGEALKALEKLLSAAKTNDDNKFHHLPKLERFAETIRRALTQTHDINALMEANQGLLRELRWCVAALEAQRGRGYLDPDQKAVLEAALGAIDKARAALADEEKP